MAAINKARHHPRRVAEEVAGAILVFLGAQMGLEPGWEVQVRLWAWVVACV